MTSWFVVRELSNILKKKNIAGYKSSTNKLYSLSVKRILTALMNMQKEKHLITCPEIFITSHITFPNGNRVCMIEVNGVFTVKSQPLPYCLSHFSDAKLNFFLKNPRKLKIGNEKKNYVHHVYINCSSLPPTKLTLYWKKSFDEKVC